MGFGRDPHDEKHEKLQLPPEQEARYDRYSRQYTPPTTYDDERWEEKNQIVELGGDIDYDEATEEMLWALRHFELRIVPKCEEIENWDDLDKRTQRMYRAGILKQYVGGYRELQELLEQDGPIAREAGFAPSDGTSYSTLASAISSLNKEFLVEAAQYSHNAAYYALTKTGTPFERASPYPPKPRAYYRENDEEWSVSMDYKMTVASGTVAEYMTLVSSKIQFGRNQSDNYKYSIGDIYRLLAHIAIEQCAVKNGAEICSWLAERDIPSSSTLSNYIPSPNDDNHKWEVEKIEEHFMDATCRLLDRGYLAPSEPIHLAYDLTTAAWYGKENRWVTGSRKKDNTKDFWHYAVLSTVSPGKNYILAATPIKERSEKAEALDRMLESLREKANPEFGRIYMDSQMFQSDIVTKCQVHDLNWMIQAPNKDKYKNIISKTPKGEVDYDEGIMFTDFSSNNKSFNAIIYPHNEEEVGREVTPKETKITGGNGKTHWSSNNNKNENEGRTQLGDYTDSEMPPVEDSSQDLEDGDDDTHTIWITNMDVKNRDLTGLGYQYRNRWKIETAIRQLKHRFQGKCYSNNRLARAIYFGAAQLFFNFWVALNQELPHLLGYEYEHRDRVHLTGLEALHAIRDADFAAAEQTNRIERLSREHD